MATRTQIKNVYKKLLANFFEVYRFENVDYNEYIDFGENIVIARIYLDENLDKLQAIKMASDFIDKLIDYIDGDILDVEIKYEHVGVANNKNKEALNITFDIDGELLDKRL